MNNNHLIIMAGGVGSRFWPMSTAEMPKQFIDVLGIGKSMIQMTVERFDGVIPQENVWVVTSQRYKNIVMEQLPMVPETQILLEPCMRNTAPCIEYVSRKIYARYPDANLVFSPADHIVMDVPEFKRVISESLRFTSNRAAILTLGMMPSRPETGYGYIKARDNENDTIKKVEAFKEKPDINTAKAYLQDGGYYWNAGIFVWNVKMVVDTIASLVPDLHAVFDRITPSFYTDNEQDMVNEYFPTCPNISIDYAVMEKADEVYVYPASFGWSDLGTWGSLYTHLPLDASNNAVVGQEVKMIDCNNCVVHTPMEKKSGDTGIERLYCCRKP